MSVHERTGIAVAPESVIARIVASEPPRGIGMAVEVVFGIAEDDSSKSRVGEEGGEERESEVHDCYDNS